MFEKRSRSIKRLRVPLAVASLAIVGVLVVSATASASRARVSFHAPSRVHADGLVVFRGQIVGASGAAVFVQRRVRGGWTVLASGHADAKGRFALTAGAPNRPGRLAVRAVVSGVHGVLAVSAVRRIRVLRRKGPPVVISPRTRVLDASVVMSAPAPGHAGTLRYAGGNDVGVGQIIVVGPGSATPDGFLGRVTKVRAVGGREIVSTRPATLLQAVPSGSLNASLNLETASAAQAALRPRSRVADLTGSCTGGHALTIRPSVSLSAGLSLDSHWSLFGGLQSASLTAHASVNAGVTASINGSASCKLSYDLPVPKAPGPYVFFVGWVPIVLTVDWSLPLDVDGSVNASTSASANAGFSASAGVGWSNNRGFYPIGSFRSHFGYTAPSITADASLAANVTPTLDVLLYGVAGPEIALKNGLAFEADISKNPWWTLTAPIDLTASLTIKQLNLSSPSLHVYRHTFPIAQACGPFGASCGSPSSVTVTNPGDQTGLAGTTARLQIQAGDTDGGSLSYSVAGLPPGLSIDAMTGLISGIPTTLGTSRVTVTATDATGPAGNATFNWTIAASPPSGSCEASSSVFVMTRGTNVVAYVPKGNWASTTTGVSLVNVEGSSVPPTLIPTANVVNSAASNPFTGETVATANNTDVYLLSGASLVNTLSSGGSGTISFSGGFPTDAGVAMDAAHNRAVITLSIAGAPGFQFLDLNSNTETSPIASPNGEVSEDPLIDPFRNLLLSASENGNFEIADISNPANPAFYENATGGGELDSTGEDCSTGIVLAPAEESDPSSVYIADLTQATLTPGSPAGTWSGPSQIQTLSESSLSAGASAVAVAQGTHTGVLAGEFGGNQITAFTLPSTSGSGTPAITDWVTCGIGNTPDSNAWSEGNDPHTMTAYQTPNGGDAIGLFGNQDASWLARVDLTQLLNPAIVPRDTAGHACAAGTIPSSAESFIAVP